MSAPRHRLSVRIGARALVASTGAALLLYLILLSEPLEEGESAALFLVVAILGGLLTAAVYEALVLATTRALTRVVGPAVSREPTAPRSALTAGYATLVLIGYFGGMFAVAFAAAFALSLIGSTDQPVDLVEAAWVLPLGMAGGAASGWWTFRRRATLRDLVVLRRWIARPTPRVLALSATAGCAVAAVAAVALPRLIPVAESFEPGIVAQMGSSSGWPRLYVALMAVVLAPVIEEVLFRGILLEGILRSTTATTAVAATALLFTLAHAPDMWGYWPGLVTVLAGGIGLAVLRLRTGSILAPITCHAAYNATLVVLSMVVIQR